MYVPSHQPTGQIAQNRLNATRRKARQSASGRDYLVHSLLLALLLYWVAGSALAMHTPDSEPYNTGWSFQFDNDVFVGGQRDQDYTGGFVTTLSGRRAAEYRLTPESLRAKIDRLIGVQSWVGHGEHRTLHALEWGAALFTPTDIQSAVANAQDRPYASLFFLNSTEQTILPSRKLSVKSGLTIGFLGLPLAERLQRGVHKALGASIPQGWDNQISDGGEITAKYSLSFQQAVHQRQFNNGLSHELNWTGKADVGFITGVGTGFNWRFGRLNTPWWSFNPNQSEYINLGSNISSGKFSATRAREHYVYAGGTVNYNAYNVFLQGQFRDSNVTADRSDVIAGTVEYWVGASVEFKNNLRVDAFVRSRTRELDLDDSQALSWGGLIIGRSF